MRKIPNIFIIGPMGSGKTTVGKKLAELLGREFFDTDRVIEKRTGVDLGWIFDIEGEESFNKRETTVLEEITTLPDIVLSTGGNVVLSKRNRELLSARGFVVYLSTSLDEQFFRTRFNKYKRPLLRGDDMKKRLHFIRETLTPLFEEIADASFISDTKSPNILANHIFHLLQKRFES